MGNELTGKKASFTYTGLVQYIGGQYYDGAGNLLNIADPSSVSAFLVQYIKDSSLNHSKFFWNGGILDISIADNVGATYEYVDGSLADRDASIVTLFNSISELISDVSGVYAYVDGSLSNRDSSITSLYNSITALSASIGNVYTGITPSTALVSDASNNITSSVVTSTELSYLSGVTSKIQLQLSKALKLAKAGL